MTGPISYLKQVRAELVHVVWPNPRQAVWHTFLIILISAVVAGYVALLDYGLTDLVNYVISR